MWGDFAAEFRSNRFSGCRYVEGGFPIATPGSPHARPPTATSPRLSTARGITLGSTLAQVRAAHVRLRRIGADTWRTASGLVFVDNATGDPVPPTARIVEIKIGTCGAF